MSRPYPELIAALQDYAKWCTEGSIGIEDMDIEMLEEAAEAVHRLHDLMD